MARDYAKKTNTRSVKNPERPDPLAKLWYVAAAFIVLVVLVLIYLKREHLETELTAPTTLRKKTVRPPIQANKADAAPTTSKPRFEFYTILPSDGSGVERLAGESTAAEQEEPSSKQTTAVLKPSPKAPPAKASIDLAKADKTPEIPATKPQHPSTNVALKPQKETATPKFPREIPHNSNNVTDKASHSAASSTASNGRYWVQVAAFHRFADADHVKAALNRQGIASVLQSSQDNGVTWIRVQVGPFKTPAQAREARERLARKKFAGVIRQGA